MKGVEIEILVYSEEELELISLDIEIEEGSEELLEKRYFWRVDYAMPYRYDTSKTSFHLGDKSFITPTEYNKFVELINNL